MLNTLLKIGNDPIFGLSVGELAFGAAVFIGGVILVAWALRKFGILH